MSINHCEMCRHKQHPDGGWCYMFRLEPKGPCAQHSIRALSVSAMRMQTAQRIFEEIRGKSTEPPRPVCQGEQRL